MRIRNYVWNLIMRYKNIIPYAIFGVLTTILNIVIYWLMAHPFKMGIILSTIIAWIVAVLFAYLTNRKWVFQSKAYTPQEIVKEIGAFFACRIATGVMDWLCMFVFVEMLQFNDVFIKSLVRVGQNRPPRAA